MAWAVAVRGRGRQRDGSEDSRIGGPQLAKTTSRGVLLALKLHARLLGHLDRAPALGQNVETRLLASDSCATVSRVQKGSP